MTHPTIYWAQRSSSSEPAKNVVYLTVAILDAKNEKIDLTSTHLKLEADTAENDTHYSVDLEFFGEIDLENSHRSENGNKIYFILRKKEAKDEYWPRLTKEKLKLHYVKTDFDKWVDEDEQDEQPEEEDDMSNMMNMGGAGGMPGMPGMGGMGGMPGMGGAGGPGGIDFSQLMQSMGGGAGGPGGNFDISQLASQLGQSGGADLEEEGDAEEEAEEKTE